MQIDNLSVLKIHKFKNKEQYERAYANGEINETDVCLTPDEELDLSAYSKKEEVSKTYETKDDANSKLNESKKYTDDEITALSDQMLFVDTEDNEDVNDPYDGGTIVVDPELSLESENPIQNKAVAREFNKFGGTVEITSGNPEKTNTVLTLDPSSESVNIYTAEETDAKLEQLSRELNERLNSIQNGNGVAY